MLSAWGLTLDTRPDWTRAFPRHANAPLQGGLQRPSDLRSARLCCCRSCRLWTLSGTMPRASSSGWTTRLWRVRPLPRAATPIRAPLPLRRRRHSRHHPQPLPPNAAGNGSAAPAPEEPSAPSTQEEAQVASTSRQCVRAAVSFQALHLHRTAVVESAPDSVPLISDSLQSSLIQELIGYCIFPASYF